MHNRGQPSMMPTEHLSLFLTQQSSTMRNVLNNGKIMRVKQGENIQNNMRISMLFGVVRANIQFL